MNKRICPICDQTMQHAHYCSHCRSYVKNPWIREVDYYLNERHPSADHACTYHEEADKVTRPVSNSAFENSSSRKRKGSRVVLIIVVIYLICQIAIPVIISLMNSVFWYWF